jgi:very-short-patch-repair endonuclease
MHKRNRTTVEILIKNGYEVLHINENDYNNDAQMVIDKCLNYLK